MSNTKKVIEYFVAARFGRVDKIPANEADKKLIVSLTGKQTLDNETIRSLKEFGVEFKHVPTPESFFKNK